MDETEKYQQRLRAIAEKRRLQEEQERAKRELEDEKLRLQQLKRKSLRDQWLMEGPPLSPDSLGPRSPLWGPEAQQIEAHINKLQGEAEKRLQTHMEDDSASAQPYTEAHSHRERRGGVKPATAGDLVQGALEKVNQTTDGVQKVAVTPSASSLTNGTVGEENSHSVPQQDEQAYANGFPDGPITLTFLGFSDVEPGQGVCDDDDSSTIIHAERVIITDEGDEITEVFQHEDPQAQVTEEPMLPNEVESADHGEVEAGTAKIWNHLEMSADHVHTEHGAVFEGRENDTDTSVVTSTDLTRASSTATSSVNNTDCGTDPTVCGLVENLADGVLAGQMVQVIPGAGELHVEQFHGETVEGADTSLEMSTILELFRMQCSTGPIHQADARCKPQQEHASQYVQATPFSTSNKFQEIPLNRAGEGSSRKPPTMRQQSENDPLLASKGAPLTETARRNQVEGVDGPKMKTCQCCSVM